LYIIGKSVKEICAVTGLPTSSVYRLIKKNELDKLRDKSMKSARASAAELRTMIPDLVKKFKKEPNAGNADAICKVINSIKSLDKRSDYVPNVIEGLKGFAIFIKNKDEKAAQLMNDYITDYINELLSREEK